MKRLRPLVLLSCFVLMAANTLPALSYNRKFDEFMFRDCTSLIARLDSFAASINNEDKSTIGLVRVYGGRVVKRGEIQMYISLVTNYLTERRGVEASRLRVVFGGYWEEAGAEIYIVPQGAAIPRPYSLVNQKDVKFEAQRAKDSKYKCARGPWD